MASRDDVVRELCGQGAHPSGVAAECRDAEKAVLSEVASGLVTCTYLGNGEWAVSRDVVVTASAAREMREAVAPLAELAYREGGYGGADPDEVEALVSAVAGALGLDIAEMGAAQHDHEQDCNEKQGSRPDSPSRAGAMASGVVIAGEAGAAPKATGPGDWNGTVLKILHGEDEAE
jgi:hypothetical protein